MVAGSGSGARVEAGGLSVLRAAEEEPERAALVVDGRVWTYAELARQVAAATRRLETRGLAPGRAVGLVGRASAGAVVLFHALVDRGTPVLLVHPRSTDEERRRLHERAGVETVLDPETEDFASLDLSEKRGEPAAGEPIPDDERPLAIVPTSGTTGEPKLVVLSRRAFLAAARASAQNLGWRDHDRWLLSLPIAHVGGLSILTRCLHARRAVVLRTLARFDPRAVARVVETDRVTLLSLVPTQLHRLLALEDWRPPDHLRAILLGGAAASPALLGRAADRGFPVLTTYGLTEACSQVATQRPGTVNRGELGCGKPLAGVEVRIRGGVIAVRGDTLLSGYLPSTESPPFDDEGWFMTGDLGRLDDAGRLHVLGRRDEVIVSGGENVSPREVEDVLVAHPAIEDACVFSVADPEWGELVAAALVAPEPPGDRDLAAFLEPRLASYKRPRRIVYLDALPRTPAGKLDRRAVARRASTRLSRLDAPR